MLASITLENLTVAQMIFMLKRAGALAADWVPGEGVVFVALWLWLMMLMLMVFKFLK